MVKPLSFKGDKPLKKRKRPIDIAAKFDAPPTTDSPPTILSHDTLSPTTKTSASVLTSTSAPAENPEPDPQDDSWVTAESASDLNGPILIVLPSDPPSCLACDASGKVFTSAIENLIGDDAGAGATAEPCDVRQVWVVSRVVGTETCTLKGFHGRYLSVDKFGILSATNEAVSPLETFTAIPTADTPGTFQLQTVRDTFLSIKPSTTPTINTTTNNPTKAHQHLPEIRGDAETISFNTTFRIRMQARFKPRLKRNKEERAREKISRRELEDAVGRRLEDGDVRLLKKARREGNYHEVLLDIKVKGKHDKYS